MLRIEKITVDYTENPVGITRRPRFSWVMASDHRNTIQVSYHLEIASDPLFSRKVLEVTKETDRSVHERFEDFSMESLTRYYWRVEITDNHGERSGFCAPGSFVTGLLGQEEWKGEFVSRRRRRTRIIRRELISVSSSGNGAKAKKPMSALRL